MRKIILILAILLSLLSCKSNLGLKEYYGRGEIKLSQKQEQRFLDYISGEYYSFEIKRKVLATQIIFGVSLDGNSSLLLSCNGVKHSCNPNVGIYQNLRKVEKKVGPVKIFAIGKKIVWNQKNIIVNNAKEWNEFKIKNNIKIIKSNQNYFFDKIFESIKDCKKENC